MERFAYSINETAHALSLGRTSVYAMIADGRLETESIRRLIDCQA